MSELIKVTYALQKKEKLEMWLSEILQEGWELVSFRYVMLGAFMNFRFVEGEKKHVKVCIYDVKYDIDEAIFLEEDWKILCRNGQSVIFYHENLEQPFPLLDMRLYTKRRLFKMSCNLLYLFSLLYCMREENANIRQPWLYLSTLILFSIPLLFDMKSTRKYSNLIRVLLNICYAFIVSIFVYLLLELIISSFYKLF